MDQLFLKQKKNKPFIDFIRDEVGHINSQLLQLF